MLAKKTISFYLLLAIVWVVFAGWQISEHYRFRHASYVSLLNRGRQIANYMGIVIRSQGIFGMVRQARLEAALEELVRSTDLRAVVLLNSSGQVVASAGKPLGLNLDNLPKQTTQWDSKQKLITIMDLVDLGTSTTKENNPPTAIVVRAEDEIRSHRDRSNSRGRNRWMDRPTSDPLPFSPGPLGTAGAMSAPPPPPPPPSSSANRNPMAMSRPFWMDPQRYEELKKKQGLHAFILQLPTDTYRTETLHDLWIRLTILCAALLATGGMSLAWRSVDRMNQLQIRLLRASEMNAHLRELNVAAAGLAHETRNPLNIVRGLAQIISQNPNALGEIRHKATVITEEVDRVTGRLNEFISYSHTPEPRAGRTNLRAVVRDVQRALESDQSEKGIILETKGPDLKVEADESLLRQVIFNLLLNAYQSVGPGGHVEVVLNENGRNGASMEIHDDGPGVPSDLREEIFKPYFTTRTEGTGLGLAVVKQIALAHQWDFEYLPGENGGAVFRVSAMRLARG